MPFQQKKKESKKKKQGGLAREGEKKRCLDITQEECGARKKRETALREASSQRCVRMCVCVRLSRFIQIGGARRGKTKEEKKKKWQTKLGKRGREGEHAEKRNSGPCPREVQRGMREWNSNATYAPAKMKLTAAHVFLWLHTLFLQKEKKSKAPLFHAFTRNMER